MEIVIGIIFLSVGFSLLYVAYQRIRRARASKLWPRVEAKIVLATLDERDDETSTDYFANLTLEYTYHDKTYQSTHEIFLSHLRNDAQMMMDNTYQTGMTIPAVVDADQPSTLLLSTEVQTSDLLLIILGLILVLISLLYFS